jgi:Cu(I)/Ag(I) efflux system membrane fusion protein
VPVSAVIDSGTRQVVLIQLKEGALSRVTSNSVCAAIPHVEVLNGVKEGELVVVSPTS